MKSYNDLIDEWHKLPESDPRTLAQYMGMTEDEYASFVMNPSTFSKEAPMCESSTDGECRWSRCPMGRQFFNGKGCDRDCPLKTVF